MPTSGSITPPALFAQSAAIAQFNLQPLAANAWHDTPVTITLPEAGTYRLGGSVSGAVTFPGGAGNNSGVIFAQWINNTTLAVIPLSGRVVVSLQKPDGNLGTTSFITQGVAPFDVLVTVTGPTTLRLQARRAGNTTVATLAGNGFGPSVVNYEKIA